MSHWPGWSSALCPLVAPPRGPLRPLAPLLQQCPGTRPPHMRVGTTAPQCPRAARSSPRGHESQHGDPGSCETKPRKEAGRAGSFWDFYFFKIIHTNGYSHEHDFNQNTASLPHQQDGTAQARAALAPLGQRRGPALRAPACGYVAVLSSFGTGVHAKIRKNSLGFVSLNYSKNKTSR